jgi:peptidoglycan-associated lipoprotein
MMNGVKSSQIRLVSYGAERPAATGNSDEDYAKNRRVELVYEALG